MTNTEETFLNERKVRNKPRAYVEIRGQKAAGAWPAQGPDTRVLVQVVPAGTAPLKVLRDDVAEKRGIQLVHVGEGYRAHQKTKRSALSWAIAEAERIANEYNEEQKCIK